MHSCNHQEDDRAMEKEENSDDEEKEGQNLTPPDGGLGWLVVVASFICNMIVDGVCFSFGIISSEFNEAFSVGHSKVGWVGSSLAGCYLLVGPFVAALCGRYGCRKVTIYGSIIAMIGFATSSLWSSIEMLIFTYGIVGGIGFGMIYLPSIVCVGFWFRKKLGIATGIVVCGTGCGQFLFPQLAHYLVTEYSWRGQTLIFGGIALNCAICGMLFIPLDHRAYRFHNKRGIVERGPIMEALIHNKQRQRAISKGSLNNCIITKDNRLLKFHPGFFTAKNNSFIIRFKRQLGFSAESLASSKNTIDSAKNGCNNSPLLIKGHDGQHITQCQTVNKWGSLPGSLRPGYRSSLSVPATSDCEQLNKINKRHSYCGMPDISPLKKEDVVEINIEQISNDGSTELTHSTNNIQSLQTIIGDIVSIKLVPNGCNGTQDKNGISYMANILKSQLPSHIEDNCGAHNTCEMEGDLNSSTLRKFCTILCDMFDLQLLFNPVFVLLVASNFLTMFAFYIPYFYLPSKGKELGISGETATFLISIIGITNTLGRIVCGWLADRPCINSIHMNNFALIFAGLAELLCPLAKGYSFLAAIAACLGLCLAIFVSLRTILLVELLGAEVLTKSFGLLSLFQGVAAFIGAPIVSQLMDTTGSIDNCFYLAGSLTILSGLLLLPIGFLKAHNDRKKQAE